MQYEHDDGMRPTTRRAQIIKVDDSKSQQRVDISGLKNEKPKKIWRPQDFGFSSNPPKDSDGIIQQMGSRSDRTLYRDAGHKDYRPKNTPEGGSVLFNHSGDIIRVFKDHMDHVHAKKINVRIGHGYKTGGGDDGEGTASAAGGAEAQGQQGEDDEKDKDEKTISIVMDGDTIVVTYQKAKVTWAEDSLTAEFDDTSVRLESGKLTHTSPHVIIKSDHVDLGGEGGVLVKRCDDSCATKVFAV